MKKLLYLIAIAATIFTASSCSDSFFERYPSNSITEGNLFQSENDFNQAVMACYYKLKTQIAFTTTELGYRSDESQLESMAVSSQNRYDLDHFAENASNSLLNDVWDAWYNGIYRCNDFLDHAEGKSYAKLPEYTGEVLFIRSWYYFNLYRTFGCVPIVTRVVTPGEAKTVARCKDEEMYERLKADLTMAAELLPQTRSSEKGRVCDIAANALLGKVALTFKHYDDAKVALEAAMANTNFGLETTTARVFDVANKGNKEVIFRVCYDKTLNEGHAHYFSSNTGVAADRNKPTAESIGLYSLKDNRLSLLDYKQVNNIYVMQKWYDTFDTTYPTIVGNDFIHLRYADVVLMYAELLALTDGGNMSDACEYLNMTRKRAGLDDFSTTDRNAFISELADERGREFMDEGQRWFDLVRLGLAVEHFTGLGYTMDSHNLIMPIPKSQLEIYGNTNILWQNPGF